MIRFFKVTSKNNRIENMGKFPTYFVKILKNKKAHRKGKLNSFYTNDHTWGLPAGGGGGGGALNKLLYWEATPRRTNPYLSYTFHIKLHPSHIPTERLLLNFSLQKPFKIMTWINQPLGASGSRCLWKYVPFNT